MVRRDRNTKRIALKQIIPTVIGGCCAFSMFSVGFSSWVVTVGDKNSINGSISADTIYESPIDCFSNVSFDSVCYYEGSDASGFVLDDNSCSANTNKTDAITLYGKLTFDMVSMKNDGVISSLSNSDSNKCGFLFEIFSKNNNQYSVNKVELTNGSTNTFNSDNTNYENGNAYGINIKTNPLMSQSITLSIKITVGIKLTFNEFKSNKYCPPTFVISAGELKL